MLFKDLNQHYTWLVVTEAWCGDATQNLSSLNKIGKIAMVKFLLDTF
jgi:hypothetical protein